nr:hypothetical transcript [Hymenolepis microstoma]
MRLSRAQDRRKTATIQRDTTSSRYQVGGEKISRNVEMVNFTSRPPYSPNVAQSDFHLVQWPTAWLTSTLARMKK